MKKYLAWTLILTLCALLTVGTLPALSEERGEKTAEAVSLLEEGFRLWQEEAMKDPERIEEMIPVKTVVPSLNMETGETEDVEMEVYTIRQDGREMRYTVQTIGEPGENGLYPLYITLHGGGGAPEEENNHPAGLPVALSASMKSPSISEPEEELEPERVKPVKEFCLGTQKPGGQGS